MCYAIRSTVYGLALAASIVPPALRAQEQAGASGAAPLEEIIVTAQKRAEPASRIPIAMTVLATDDLNSSGVVNVSQLADVAPSVIVGRDAFGVNINIRGVTTTDTTSKGEQGIAFNVDGIAIGRPMVQGLSLFDVERIEVLRGPQGTLYGKSTTGGAVNVITHRPASTFAASASIETGNYNTVRADGMINVPVNDSIALRAAVNSNRRDGYLEPADGSTPRNDQKDTSGRLSALFKFSEDTSLLLSATAGRVGGVGYSSVPLANVIDHSGEAQRQVFGNPFRAEIDDHFANFNAELNSTIGDVTITYIGAHHEFTADELTSATWDPATNPNPVTGTPQYGWRHYTGTFETDSHELRAANDSSAALTWVVGANWNREDIHEDDHFLNAPITDPTLQASTNGIDPVNNTVHESQGVFGQASYEFSDALRATLGARWSDDGVERRGTFAAGPFGVNGLCPSPPPLVPCIGGPNNGEQSASKVTYRVGLDYFPAPGHMLYGHVATGYKAGGFNDFDPATGGVGTYDPESLTAYELGYKGHLADSLQLNSSVYYYDYSKSQISSLVNISGNFVIYTRAVPTTIYGWESELTWRMSDTDILSAAFTAMESEYERFSAGLFQNVDWSGRSLDKTPGFAATLGYSHDWTLSNGGTIRGHIATRYSGSYLVSDFVAAIQYTQDSFTRTDVTLTYTDASAKYFLQAFAKNLEDEVQILTLPGNSSASVSEPRFYGLRMGLKF